MRKNSCLRGKPADIPEAFSARSTPWRAPFGSSEDNLLGSLPPSKIGTIQDPEVGSAGSAKVIFTREVNSKDREVAPFFLAPVFCNYFVLT